MSISPASSPARRDCTSGRTSTSRRLWNGTCGHVHRVVQRVEVLVVALEDEVLIVGVTDEAVGAGAHGGAVHLRVTHALGVGAGDHDDGAGQRHDEEARVRGVEFDQPGAVVDRLVAGPVLGAVGRAGAGPASRVVGRLAAVVVLGDVAGPVVGELRVLGREDRAVVERRGRHRRGHRHVVDPLGRDQVAVNLVRVRLQPDAVVVHALMGDVVGVAAGAELVQPAVVRRRRRADGRLKVDAGEGRHGLLFGRLLLRGLIGGLRLRFGLLLRLGLGLGLLLRLLLGGGLGGGRGGGVIIVVVAAADQGEARRADARLGAGAQHRAAADAPAVHGGPVVHPAHRGLLPRRVVAL